jgi:type IV secretory pathway TrbD component
VTLARGVLFLPQHTERRTMSKLLRGAVAGLAAWKLGGGLIGTIVVFVLLWWILGHFGVFS